MGRLILDLAGFPVRERAHGAQAACRDGEE
jgi:hypothetical protein